MKIHRKLFFFSLEFCGEGYEEQWKINLSPKVQNAKGPIVAVTVLNGTLCLDERDKRLGQKQNQFSWRVTRVLG